ncbi:hypothetical protein ACNQF7_16025 [Flavobacterium sp. RSP29]|uniref:hypothetical protein n=1 Tax=Flavobacterium sp. RSP29 TaxID=3401731 RepID=UPI003AAB3C73
MIDLNFPITLEHLEFSQEDLEQLTDATFSSTHLQVGENDFFLNVHNVATYRVQNGNSVLIFRHENADLASIKLFLNGSVLGAVLHQQGTLPFHGSCFQYNEKGVLLCGDSGAGKSSVTVAFCQNGACFINDDITPVAISESETIIIPIKTRIKLWDDSFQKLKIENDDFEKIRPTLNKFYLPTNEEYLDKQQLHHIFILSTHNNEHFETFELEGMVKYDALRKQIYREMYLKGMPERHKSYFKQLFQLAKNVRVTHIKRPQICDIYTTMETIKKELV